MSDTSELSRTSSNFHSAIHTLNRRLTFCQLSVYRTDGIEEHLNLNDHTFHILPDSMEVTPLSSWVPTATNNGRIHILVKPPVDNGTNDNGNMAMDENTLSSVTSQTSNTSPTIIQTPSRRQRLGRRAKQLAKVSLKQLGDGECHLTHDTGKESIVGQIVKLNTIGTTHQVAGRRTFMARLIAQSTK